MSALAKLMDTFHSALLTKDGSAAADTLRTNPRIAPQKQMAIYIEGYRLRLIQAIRSDYPTLLALLGEQDFDALALRFIEDNPPRHFNLDRYPHAFAAFVKVHGGDAFAADMAALEAAIAQTFMLEDSPPLTPEMLRGISPETFGSTVLALRTASCLLAMEHDAEACLLAVRDGKPAMRSPVSACYLMLVRHHNEVQRHALSYAEFLMLQTLRRGLPVGKALEALAEAHPDYLPEIAGQLQPWFTRWTEHGFFQSLK